MKMARELNRIKINVEKSKPHKLYFLLRSGFLLSEFFNYPSIKKEIINPKFFNEDLKEGYIIDDCVVMARSLKKLNLKKDSRFTLSVLDCAMPKRIYEKDIRINILKNLYQLKMNGKLNYEECLEEFKKSLEGGSEFDILIEGIIKNISTNRIRWFDVGIGDGHYLKKIVTILEKKGFVVEVNGIDNDEKSVREAISVFPDGKILQGDFLKIDKSRRCNNALQT
ncbi:MAG: hypothetical protein KKF52_05305 [Nanoarchaeota archaeon]|nr:hypothetical protein [Nanoarchaeota archaeon]